MTALKLLFTIFIVSTALAASTKTTTTAPLLQNWPIVSDITIANSASCAKNSSVTACYKMVLTTPNSLGSVNYAITGAQLYTGYDSNHAVCSSPLSSTQWSSSSTTQTVYFTATSTSITLQSTSSTGHSSKITRGVPACFRDRRISPVGH